MSSWKLVKAVMGAQLIWAAIATIIMGAVALFSFNKENENGIA